MLLGIACFAAVFLLTAFGLHIMATSAPPTSFAGMCALVAWVWMEVALIYVGVRSLDR